MAIKTRKITDLSELTFTHDLTESGLTDFSSKNIWLLGSRAQGSSNVTGKVSADGLMKLVQAIVVHKLGEATLASEPMAVATLEVEETPVLADVETKLNEVSVSLTSINEKLTSLDSKQKNFSYSTTKKFSDVNEQIAVLTEKITALESFVQALQKDGYLTLAEIKKAAAQACPICTHTHEEEQPTE